MKKRILLSLLILFALLTVWAGRSQAAPARQTNLLQNPGFEQPFNGGAAQGWQTWHMLTPKEDEECLIAYHYQPKWGVETASGFVREGAASQYIGNNWDTWAGGVYQTVPATPGVTYRFSFTGRGRGSSADSPSPSETQLQINMRAGIDPNGSGAWNDADIVWGAAGSPHDSWQTFTVEATATGNQLTVFTAANWGVSGVNQCRQFLDTWYDAAQLVAQTPPTAAPPTAAPPTAAVATATFTPAPAEGSATDTPPPAMPAGRSSICVNAFLDNNGNGQRDADEGYVTGVTLTVAQGATIIGQAVSTGAETPTCFENLLPGEYQIAQSLPATLETTTQSNATVNLGEGQNIGLEFGSRPRATAMAQASPTTTTAATPTLAAPGTIVEPANGGPNWLIFLGLGAVLIGIALLGALLFMLLRR
ncbi:SdrD B-like domain-containing protein [Promineifilum sp.]|uniref:SdrD B-like domain-containing protein n=1 Tax=Promineifilum sp. TaxID=2664178 RepID=UPI0035B0523E